jgi:hypothetical protein
VAVNFRRVAQWSSAISVLLLITFMAVLPGTYEKMEPMLDPEQQNVARLEAGESASVDFVGGHVYVALRVSEDGNDPVAELRLFDEENQEFSGDSPTRLHVERFVNGTSYAPVRVFCFPNGCDSGTYTLHNEGDSVLWLVDDSASDFEFFTEPLVLATFATCCLGVMSGIIALIFAILMFQNKSNQDGKQVSGLIIDGRVMTTDELYRAHQEQNKEISDVPDPFVRSSANNQAIEPISDENDLQIGEEEGVDAWKGWDEG